MRARRFIVLLTVVTAFALPLETALAGGGERRPARSAKGKDYVAELKAEELAFLKARIKGWDELDARQKQMIARNVLRIRQLSPEQRKHFEERLKRMRTRDKRWERMRDHAGRMLVERGLAQAARKRLGRDFEARLRRSDISAHVFERAFARAFWAKVTASAFADGKPVAPDALPKDLPEHHVRRYRSFYARYSASEDAERRKRIASSLGFWYSSMLAARLRHELAQSDVKGTDAYLAAVARKVQQTWPREFAASLADPDALRRAAENEEVKRSLRRLVRRDGRLLPQESALLVKLVERWAVANRKRDAEAGAEADAVVRRVLREDLGVADEVVRAMPPRTQLERRAAWYLQVLRRHLGHRGPGGRGMDGRKGRGPRGMRMPHKPDGVSKETWGKVQKAWREALMQRRAPVRPEGVDQGTWDKALAAWKKHMESLKERRR